MATKLDDLSVAIGALQEGQRRAEQSRVENAEGISRRLHKQEQLQCAKFDEITRKLEALAESIEGKVDKATKRIFHGCLGGAGIVMAQYIAEQLGFKFPFP